MLEELCEEFINKQLNFQANSILPRSREDIDQVNYLILLQGVKIEEPPELNEQVASGIVV